jgi:hypothetical protein
MGNEFGRTWKERIVEYFRLYFKGGTEENHENPQL